MSINRSAVVKASALILVVWGLYASSQLFHSSSAGVGTVRGDGAAELQKAGLQVRFIEGVAVVASVSPGSLADISGLKVGDKIKSVDRLASRKPEDFVGFFAEGAKGRNLVIDRNGELLVDRVIGQKPPAPQATATDLDGVPPLGLNVIDMIGMYPDGVRAPMAMEPKPGTSIAKAGIKAGEWILAANKAPIMTAADYRRLVDATEGPMVLTVLNTEHGKREQREVQIR